ncbi:TolC family protein [Bdellovibrio svalbardensis]|uniref:TolC family protein n=1 Tax=Bdellovibrio svalbardensis TaxID=2972972 RepID=A0ABT6DLC1_9BACT|nr:TolC family protein [Bdellovibrio svalbardensis]MDG0817673.1 TolC family protein [Bdellovibrio svalbardensis]
MKKRFLLVSLFVGLKAFGMEGLTSLEQQLSEKNQTLEALKNELRAKEHILQSSYSNYYPTFNAVGGWGDKYVDDPGERDKGYFGYIDGRLNLFNGFKHVSTSDQRTIEAKLTELEYEQTRRDLKMQLIEVTSEMIYLHKLQEILFEEEKITKSQKSWAQKKVSAGLTSSVDNLEFDLREDEIRIQHRQIDQLHKESHLRLVHLFGADVADSDLDKLNFTSVAKLTDVPTFSPEKNLDNQKATLQSRLSEAEKKNIKADFMPTVDFVYSFGRLTPSENSPMKFNESNYALQVVIPLFTGFDTVYKNRSADSNLASSKARSAQTQVDSLSLFNALSEKIKELSDLYVINERKLESSKKYFDLTVSEYKRGIKNSPDLVSATERWFSSQKRKFELLKELELTRVKLDNLN